MTCPFTPDGIVNRLGADRLVSTVGSMGIYPVHSTEPFQVKVTQEELNGFWRRIGDRLKSLDSKLVNRSNVCHIIGEDRDLNMVGYDYIVRRIDSGEAMGSELKDLRIVKEIADTILDYRALRDAIDDGDVRLVNRIMSKYPTSKTEGRRSKARKKAVEVA